tara:strand:+ start:26357 stop:26962 length:606 start_codon:yes stop_codon:yes gene_type:complete
MGISNLILIDLGIVILTIIIITLISDDNNFLFKQEEPIKLDNIPQLDEILNSEKLSRKTGSGIELSSLIGVWKFNSVWEQGTNNENKFASKMLRLFIAKLELKEYQTNDKKHELNIINSIEFGLLSLAFIGYGNLEGKQPILPFFFDRIEIKLGKKLLLMRNIKHQPKHKRPFFALVGLWGDGIWLSARGRGGGLALWCKD